MIGCLEDFVPHSAMTCMTLHRLCPFFQCGHAGRVECGYHLAIGRTAQVLIMNYSLFCAQQCFEIPSQILAPWSNASGLKLTRRFKGMAIQSKISNFQSMNYTHLFNFRAICHGISDFIAELRRLEGPSAGAPYPYRKETETHELTFPWLSWLAVLLVGTYARR